MSTVLKQNENISLTVVTDEVGFDLLEIEWRNLFSSVESSTVPLQWDWMREWWRFYGDKYGGKSDGLRILVVRNADRLIGILPLYLRTTYNFLPRSLCFLSTGEDDKETIYPEYLNLLAQNQDINCCLQVISKHLYNDARSEWDECFLGILAPNSSLLRLAERPLCKFRFLNRKLPSICPKVDLSGGFDLYLNSHSASQRQQFKRLLKQAGDPSVKFEVATTFEEGELYLDELIELHQARWNENGSSGAFASNRKVSFLKSLTEKLLLKRQVLITKLSKNGAPIAVLYGFINQGKFDFYQSGVNIDCRDFKSPGIVAHLLTMSYLAEQRISTYDFLAGQSEYKKRLATGERYTYELTLKRPTIRTFLNIAVVIFKKIKLRIQRFEKKLPQA